MGPVKVLFVCHNHPVTRPGGAEAYAHELHRALADDGRVETVFMAKGGPPMSLTGATHSGTYIAPVGTDPSEYFLYTDGYEFDWLFGTITDKDFYTKHCRRILEALRPDVVHFQHTLFLGYDLVREVRNTLPDAAIVYTLHEYLPICHRQGQMLRVIDNERCMESSPKRCSECFPQIAPETFFLRRKFIQSQLALVDMFLAPSRFLLERFVDWGIPRARIQFEEYGRLPVAHVAADRDRDQRNRLGFFGQLSPYKGVLELLEAMQLLADGDHRRTLDPALMPGQSDRIVGSRDHGSGGPPPHLWVHGANLDLQEEGFRQRFLELVDQPNVTFVGRYDHDQLPALMENVDWVVVPSIWWENSPLVIQEAFLHRRPVICSDVGGMAEKVEDSVSGLLFRAGSPSSMAETIRHATSNSDVWAKLRSGIPELYPMADHVERLLDLYHSLLRDKRP